MAKEIPPPVFINLIVGGRCGLSCPFCQSWRQDIPEMSAQLWDTLFTSLGKWVPGRIVSLSGGEPLMHQQIDEIVFSAHTHGLAPNLCTSGDQFTVEMIERIATWPLEGLTISIDGFALIHDKSRGREGLFDRVIGLIDYLKEIKPELKIVTTTVIHNKNIDQLKELTNALVENSRISQLSFQAVTHQSNFDKKWDGDQARKFFPSPEKADAFLNWLFDMHDRTDKIKNSKRQIAVWKMYFRSPENVRSLMDICQIGSYTLTVLPNGNVTLCDFYSHIGNLDQGDVKDIWHSQTAIKLRTKMKRCDRFCNFLINCGFDDFHLSLLSDSDQKRYLQSIER
jgi:MoaA/NifB/PqqE/SkfB family radical SAM enzyme